MTRFLQQQLVGHDNGGDHQAGCDVDAARTIAEVRVTATDFRIKPRVCARAASNCSSTRLFTVTYYN